MRRVSPEDAVKELQSEACEVYEDYRVANVVCEECGMDTLIAFDTQLQQLGLELVEIGNGADVYSWYITTKGEKK